MVVKSALFVKSAVKLSQFPQDEKREYMFCGRSNVGKSSFINALVNKKGLAKTSQTPGKTQTLNIYNINDELYLVDVPGYGYARVSKKMIEEFGKMIEDYVVSSKNLKKAFLLVDFRHVPTEDDCLMFNFLKYYDIKVVVIATKADKVNRSQYLKNEKLIKEKLGLTSEDVLIITSSQAKLNIDKVLSELEE